MRDPKIPTLAVLASLACSSALAAGSLEQWEMTSKTIGAYGAMPEQKMIICKKKEEAAKPPLQSNCKYTSLSGSASRGSFVMECTGEHPSTIKGEGSQTGDTMEGTMTITTGGVTVQQAYSGKRIGSCEVEGGRNAGTPGLPGGNMQSMFDPRNRPATGGNPVPSPAAVDGAPAATDAPATDEKPASSADKAKKALKKLLPF